MALELDTRIHYCGPYPEDCDADGYWTEERIRSAQPIEMPPGPQELTESPGPGETVGDGLPFPVDVNQSPYWNVGKFLFTTDSGVNSWGTAALVGSNQIPLTAAHCIVNATTKKCHT